MSAGQLGVLCTLAAGAVASMAVALAGSAALARLCFSCRIEIIRAEAVTAALDGTPRRDAAVTGWLAALDAMARPACWSRLAMTVALTGDPAVPSCAGYDDLTPGEQHLIASLTARTCAATSCYLAWGRLPGSLLLPFSRLWQRH